MTKALVLSWLWLGFDPWPRNFYLPQAWAKKKKKKKVKLKEVGGMYSIGWGLVEVPVVFLFV